ncbi:hypothetical protein PDR5_56380 [Pseudomonas sp. DR 5-09]|nr:hypothetical protein PDR5_56380 [Pseudomonas sp. DR 5-09]
MRHGQLLAELPILLDRSSDNFLMGVNRGDRHDGSTCTYSAVKPNT